MGGTKKHKGAVDPPSNPTKKRGDRPGSEEKREQQASKRKKQGDDEAQEGDDDSLDIVDFTTQPTTKPSKRAETATPKVPVPKQTRVSQGISSTPTPAEIARFQKDLDREKKLKEKAAAKQTKDPPPPRVRMNRVAKEKSAEVSHYTCYIRSQFSFLRRCRSWHNRALWWTVRRSLAMTSMQPQTGQWKRKVMSKTGLGLVATAVLNTYCRDTIYMWCIQSCPNATVFFFPEVLRYYQLNLMCPMCHQVYSGSG